MTKKAEITVTTFVYTILICLSVIVLIGGIVNGIVSNYNKEQVKEFQKYQSQLNDFSANYTKDLSTSQDINDVNNNTAPFFIKLTENLQNAYLDSTIGRALNTVGKFLKSSGFAFKSVTSALGDIPNFPTIITGLILTLILLVGVFTFVKAYWEKKL